MKSKLIWAAMAAMGAAAATPASALEALELYDNFNGTSIDAKKWPDQTVRVREVLGKKLHLVSRDYGSDDTDVGSVGTTWAQQLPDPAKVTSLRATMAVNRIQAIGCTANPVATEARARLYLTVFNIATPTPGSLVNDVSAQVRVIRRSNSTDAAGVLRVEGVVFRCLDNTCSNSETLGSVDLGTAKLGTAVTAQLEWDKANNRFLFRRDADAKRSVKYTVADKNEAGSPGAHVGLRTTVPNCTAAKRASALVDATFDNVYVNASAVP